MPPDQLASVLRRVAASVSASLDLKEVFGRVAEAASAVLDFDVMIILRHAREDSFTVHAIRGEVKEPVLEAPVHEFSPALREFLTAGGRTDDLVELVDDSFPLDRKVLEDERRSAIAIPIRRAGRLDAVVSVASR